MLDRDVQNSRRARDIPGSGAASCDPVRQTTATIERTRRMQELTVVGVESGTLVVSAPDGTRYRVPVAESQLAQLRRTRAEGIDAARKVAPREIQAHIRAGRSAQEVVQLTGADIDYVERFVGPVMAERDHVVTRARAVPVHTAADAEPDEATGFGDVIAERLEAGGAGDVAWTSWKDPETGWVVQLTFTAEQIDRDARWSFDPRKQALSPLNPDAVALSQQAPASPSLIPRLRAVPLDRSGEPNRFDSGAFAVDDVDARDAAVAPISMNQTADLLEALRRRRGEREARPVDQLDEPEAAAEQPAPTTAIRLVEVPLDGMEPPEEATPAAAPAEPATEAPAPAPSAAPERIGQPGSLGPVPAAQPGETGPVPGRARKGRAAMPSWDEIVFGARSDDDL
jgi:hypothetical protein